MAKGASTGGKRERLIEAAVALAHRQGYQRTTLASLAEEANVPLGNIYYYFKSREEIGNAILDHRGAEFDRMREALDRLDTPLARLDRFVEASVANAAVVASLGCPLGSLSAELLKDAGSLAERSNALLARPMAWMAEQFAAMGHARDAEALALQLQSSLQGASLLTQSFRDPVLLEREGARLREWLQSLQR